jgi:hypothetical protein
MGFVTVFLRVEGVFGSIWAGRTVSEIEKVV